MEVVVIVTNYGAKWISDSSNNTILFNKKDVDNC